MQVVQIWSLYFFTLGYQVKELPSRYFSSAKGKVAMEELVAFHHHQGNRQNTLGAIPIEEGQSVMCLRRAQFTL